MCISLNNNSVFLAKKYNLKLQQTFIQEMRFFNYAFIVTLMGDFLYLCFFYRSRFYLFSVLHRCILPLSFLPRIQKITIKDFFTLQLKYLAILPFYYPWAIFTVVLFAAHLDDHHQMFLALQWNYLQWNRNIENI